MVRPVDWSSRSSMISKKMPKENTVTMRRYCSPPSTMAAMAVWVSKNAREKNSPNSRNSAVPSSDKNSPLWAERWASGRSLHPRLRDRSAFTPTAVPEATAIMKFCMGKARDTAVSASSLNWDTK